MILFHYLFLEDIDFKSEVITVTVEPGQQTVDVVFELLDDELAEGNETFCLFLFIPDTASDLGVNSGAIVCAEAVILGRSTDLYRCPTYPIIIINTYLKIYWRSNICTCIDHIQ